MQDSLRDPVSELVRKILIIEKRRPMRDVAAALGMEYANLHARLTGRSRFRAAEMSALICEIPDLRLCDLLLNNTPFVAVTRPEPSGDVRESALTRAAQLANESIAIIEQLSTAVVKGSLDPEEHDELVAHLSKAERAVGGLRLSFFALAPDRRTRLDCLPESAGKVEPARECEKAGT